jgi:type VI secretion system secreted protein Hcp
MREQWFLKLDGIGGESTSARHRGEIEIDSWSWGATNSASAHSGGGAAAGRVAIEDFQLATRVSAATPPLFLACATGRHLRTAVLTGVRSGEAEREFLTYKLTDVVVTSVHHGDSSASAPGDRFSLQFAKVEVTYRPQRPDGSTATPVTVSYDVAAHR